MGHIRPDILLRHFPNWRRPRSPIRARISGVRERGWRVTTPWGWSGRLVVIGRSGDGADDDVAGFGQDMVG